MDIQDTVVIDGQTKHNANQSVLSLIFKGWWVEPKQFGALIICEHAYRWNRWHRESVNTHTNIYTHTPTHTQSKKTLARNFKFQETKLNNSSTSLKPSVKQQTSLGGEQDINNQQQRRTPLLLPRTCRGTWQRSTNTVLTIWKTLRNPEALSGAKLWYVMKLIPLAFFLYISTCLCQAVCEHLSAGAEFEDWS